MKPAHTREVITLLLIAVGVALTAFHLEYFAYEDDFLQLRMACWDSFSWWNNDMAAEGRPLYGLIVLNAWKLLGSTENAIWLRAFGVIGFLLTTLAIYAACRLRWDTGRVVSACIAVIVLLTPAMAVSTFWGAAAPHSWAAALAFLAGWMSLASLDRWRPRWGLWIGASCLALAAEMIYQAMAGFFLLPLALELVLRGDRNALLRAFRSLTHFGGILLVYFASYKLAVISLFPESERAARAGALSAMGENLIFYVFKTLPFISTSWSAFLWGAWLGWTHLFVCVGILYWCFSQVGRVGWGKAVAAVVCLGALVIAAGAPLVASGTYAPYRTLAVPAALITLISAAGWYRMIPRRWPFRFVVPVAATVFVAMTFRHFVSDMVVQPRSTEHRAFEDWIDKNVHELPSVITAVPADLPGSRYMPIHEYGRYNSNVDWTLKNLLEIMIAERLGLEPSDDIQSLYPEMVALNVLRDSDPRWYRGLLVDAREILGQIETSPLRDDSEAPLSREILPELESLGVVEISPSGWVRHPHLGWFLPGPANWIRHESAGWLMVLARTETGLRLYGHDFGVVMAPFGTWPLVHAEGASQSIDIHEQVPWARLRRKLAEKHATR